VHVQSGSEASESIMSERRGVAESQYDVVDSRFYAGPQLKLRLLPASASAATRSMRNRRVERALSRRVLARSGRAGTLGVAMWDGAAGNGRGDQPPGLGAPVLGPPSRDRTAGREARTRSGFGGGRGSAGFCVRRRGVEQESRAELLPYTIVKESERERGREGERERERDPGTLLGLHTVPAVLVPQK
jgi:hypothetical protein